MKQLKVYKVAFAVTLISTIVFASLYVTENNNASTGKYEFLARRVQIDSPNKVSLKFSPLRVDLENQLAQYKNVKNVSVYFEYLPTGVSFKINEDSEYIAASLMKLPYAMNLYKAAEDGLIDLDKKITLKKEFLNSDYGQLYEKGEGYELTLRDAVDILLKDSDNTALMAIDSELTTSGFNSDDGAINSLDLSFDIVEEGRVKITAQSYTSILKCLYFACYNNLDSSNAILTSLTKSSFNDRLTRYLPEDLKVAHKIGTFSDKFQSDCGVFYIEMKNYSLCVLVEGEDPLASKIIADVSQKVYIYVRDNIKLDDK